MDILEIKQQLADFKAIKAKGTITPESLGALLENIVEFVTNPFAATKVLQVNVFDSKTKFVRMTHWIWCWQISVHCRTCESLFR